MKNKLAALALILAAASVQAQPSPQEAFCQALSNVAETAAQGKARGLSEQQASHGLTSSMTAFKVVSFVYATPLGPADVKKVVFARCLAGVYK